MKQILWNKSDNGGLGDEKLEEKGKWDLHQT